MTVGIMVDQQQNEILFLYLLKLHFPLNYILQMKCINTALGVCLPQKRTCYAYNYRESTRLVYSPVTCIVHALA
ncbi:hypothetical protein XELAEV_18000670mg [Xenopus laevis]|nr:hypothetical protein XELAEV_18000670mg [Xenopus laevis]